MTSFRVAICLLAGLVASGCQSAGNGSGGQAFTFETANCVLGQPPPQWTPAEADGVGTPAEWTIAEDRSAPVGARVLSVESKNPERTFNLCILDEFVAEDCDVAANIKPRSGQDDQGGGLVVRLQDSQNYYLARWSPLEKNLRLYLVENGKRLTIKSAELDVAPGWHKIALKCRGPAFEVSFDGAVVLSATNSAITKKGKVGLWTKADACSSFDDIELR